MSDNEHNWKNTSTTNTVSNFCIIVDFSGFVLDDITKFINKQIEKRADFLQKKSRKIWLHENKAFYSISNMTMVKSDTICHLTISPIHIFG